MYVRYAENAAQAQPLISQTLRVQKKKERERERKRVHRIKNLQEILKPQATLIQPGF